MLLYQLSRLIPVRFTSSTYDAIDEGVARSERSTWWQWRKRVWRHRTEAVA